MSIESVVSHPGNERLIIIRKWAVVACDGNHCAAALLNFFEYWHKIRIEQAQKAKEQNILAQKYHDECKQDDSLLQFHTADGLRDGILGLFSKEAITSSLKVLTSKGFISVHRNPNPRYSFDCTRHFLFHPDTVQAEINRISPSSENRRPGDGKQATGVGKPYPGRRKTDFDCISQDHYQDHLPRVPQPPASELIPAATEDDCLAVYEAYPKKVGRPKALSQIKKAIDKHGLPFVLQKTRLYAESRKDQDPQFTPHPATWFAQDRFLDDPATWAGKEKSFVQKAMEQDGEHFEVPDLTCR